VILFLDDDPNRAALAYQRWSEERRSNTIWCTTAEECLSVLQDDYDLTEAHLDHDLGGATFVDTRREDCGMEVVRWLENRTPKQLKKFEKCQFICHSWNIGAGRTMTERLKKIGLQATQLPFGMGR
jgi:hypothetical protein